MNDNLASSLTTAVLVACAVIVTGIVIRRELSPAPAASQFDLKPRRVSNWSELLSAGQWIGPSDARVRIVEFSDFQCPFCARTQPAIEAVRRRHPATVAVLYRHFPLDAIHDYARPAAVAAECAGEQGRFEPYANLLFAQQDSFGAKPWTRFAAESGVADTAGFARCVRDARPAANVERDAAAGRGIRIEVTPTLVIDGTLRPGAVTEAELESLVQKAGGR